MDPTTAAGHPHVRVQSWTTNGLTTSCVASSAGTRTGWTTGCRSPPSAGAADAGRAGRIMRQRGRSQTPNHPLQQTAGAVVDSGFVAHSAPAAAELVRL